MIYGRSLFHSEYLFPPRRAAPGTLLPASLPPWPSAQGEPGPRRALAGPRSPRESGADVNFLYCSIDPAWGRRAAVVPGAESWPRKTALPCAGASGGGGCRAPGGDAHVRQRTGSGSHGGRKWKGGESGSDSSGEEKERSFQGLLEPSGPVSPLRWVVCEPPERHARGWRECQAQLFRRVWTDLECRFASVRFACGSGEGGGLEANSVRSHRVQGRIRALVGISQDRGRVRLPGPRSQETGVVAAVFITGHIPQCGSIPVGTPDQQLGACGCKRVCVRGHGKLKVRLFFYLNTDRNNQCFNLKAEDQVRVQVK